jgi:nicotinate-nucleotide adenylyltransferase
MRHWYLNLRQCIKTVQVALTFQYRSQNTALTAKPVRVAILPGAWNPPTTAHLAIANAAAEWADEVILALPTAFPHKDFGGATFADRLAMLLLLANAGKRLSVATTEGSLYVEIGAEAAEYLGPQVEIGLVCGRDAAERIAAWDYGKPGVFEAMLARHPLLVAARGAEYAPVPQHADHIVKLPMDACFSEVSSTEVRRRIARGEPWRHLVPPAIADMVAALYVP